MSILKQITNALFAGTNENNLQLASLKLDFSLVKVEAPAEFAALGSALTAKRRNEAEEGRPHRTARRLAALFEELVPSTPKLVTAYGLRVSEIIQKPNINPRGSDSHGAFKDYIGADATAIWAAATSGIPALGVYLLACLLARAWEATRAVSIWVELVSERRKEIESAFRSNAIVSHTSLIGCRQSISRDDLALLDASARSWLRSADRGKQREQDQLRLILANLNVNVPFPSGPSTYTKVISSWRQAMIGMEELLAGRPQSISSGSVLLAFFSWHLFPDLIVLGKKTANVKFRDPHFPSSGVGTIGFTSADVSVDGGMRWSLTLSHLRHYGDPVAVASNDGFSCVTCDQLCVLAFGSILSSWGVNARDTKAAARWFRRLWITMRRNKTQVQCEALQRQFGWLFVLVRGAESLLLSTANNRQNVFNLIKYGYRRGKEFLGLGNRRIAPYFGLCNPCVLAGLSQESDIECGIRYLRAVAASIGLRCGEAIIIYRHVVHMGPAEDDYDTYYEYATAVPHLLSSPSSDGKDSGALKESHARWLHPDPEHMQSRRRSMPHSEGLLLRSVESRQAEILTFSEQCYIVAAGPDRPKVVQYMEDLQGCYTPLCWRKPPLVYSEDGTAPSADSGSSRMKNSQGCCPFLLSGEKDCRCFEPQETKLTPTSVASNACYFSPIMGNWRFGLFARHEENSSISLLQQREKANTASNKALDLNALVDKRMSASISTTRLWDYLCYVISEAWTTGRKGEGSTSPGTFLVAAGYKLPEPCCWSLYALCAAFDTFRNLNGASISVKLISAPLVDSLWIPDLTFRERDIVEPGDDRDLPGMTYSSANSNPTIWPPVLETQTRSQAFACITHLVSGTINIDPEKLRFTLAMCWEDSIYVSGLLLSDPAQRVAANDIRRLVGNIGHKGICMLVAPEDARVRPPEDNYAVVTHAAYDLKRENNFTGTTLHLSFTDWFVPLDTRGERTIDQEVYLVESIISVLDRGRWVADLDILAADFENLVRVGTNVECEKDHTEDQICDYTALDSWEEVLDYPDTVGIVRAYGNWVARLAAVSILTQKGQGHCIAVFDERDFCLKCLETCYAELSDRLEPFQSHLPSFCID